MSPIITGEALNLSTNRQTFKRRQDQQVMMNIMLATFAAVAFLSHMLSTTAFTAFKLTRRRTATRYNMAVESGIEFGKLDGTNCRIGIIKTRWNSKHVSKIVAGAREALKDCNVTDSNIFETEVPGAFELPIAARFLALSGTVDAVICCGVLVKGDTMHFEYICEAVSSGIMSVGLQTSTPCIFGVLTCMDESQVVKRTTGNNNHGNGWGKTAIEMALLRQAALGKKSKMSGLGFGSETPVKDPQLPGKKERVGFF